MRKYFFIVLMLVMISSCSFNTKKGIKISIENKSNHNLENVSLSTTENVIELKLEKLNKGDVYSDFLSLKDNKVDGAYVIKFKRQNKEFEEHRFGYYTNGTALEDSMKIEILNNEIQVKYGKEK